MPADNFMPLKVKKGRVRWSRILFSAFLRVKHRTCSQQPCSLDLWDSFGLKDRGPCFYAIIIAPRTLWTSFQETVFPFSLDSKLKVIHGTGICIRCYQIIIFDLCWKFLHKNIRIKPFGNKHLWLYRFSDQCF